MSTVIIVDATPPKRYDASTLDREPTGGTIGTVIRVAEGLGKDHDVFVFQSDPPKAPEGTASYLPLEEIRSVRDPTACIFVRGNLWKGAASVPAIRQRHPKCKMFYWSHTTMPHPWLTFWGNLYSVLIKRTFLRMARLFREYHVGVLGTSRFHTQSIQRTLGPDIPIGWIYNPVEEMDTELDSIGYDPDKLLFMSSPDRGLKRALQILSEARKVRSSFRLFVASPGYLRRSFPDRSDVVRLGPLPRRTLFEHIRGSLCVFYPNLYCAEAFGLIFAESNTLNTPVLTHPLGAAAELLSDPSQLVDCQDPVKVVDRLVAWAAGERPVVRGRKAYSLGHVIPLWEDLLVSDHPVAFQIDR